jgi:hypothetical protein
MSSDSAWVGEFLAGILYLIVSLRLARLASRTGERPERLLSAMFLFSGISYILYIVPLAISNEALWTPFNFAGRVCYIPAPIFLALFTREVFRSSRRISTCLVLATPILLVFGVGSSVLIGDWEGFSLGNPFFWFEWVGYTVPFMWAGMEAFGEYRSSLRRHRVGLCDRMVCNRLLLWSIFGTAQVALSVILLQMYSNYETTNTFSALLDRMTALIEFVSLGLVWLVFFPPRFYQKFISGSDVGENSVEGN